MQRMKEAGSEEQLKDLLRELRDSGQLEALVGRLAGQQGGGDGEQRGGTASAPSGGTTAGRGGSGGRKRGAPGDAPLAAPAMPARGRGRQGVAPVAAGTRGEERQAPLLALGVPPSRLGAAVPRSAEPSRQHLPLPGQSREARREGRAAVVGLARTRSRLQPVCCRRKRAALSTPPMRRRPLPGHLPRRRRAPGPVLPAPVAWVCWSSWLPLPASRGRRQRGSRRTWWQATSCSSSRNGGSGSGSRQR